MSSHQITKTLIHGACASLYATVGLGVHFELFYPSLAIAYSTLALLELGE